MSIQRIFSTHWILILAKLFCTMIDPGSQTQRNFLLFGFRNQGLDPINSCASKHYLGCGERRDRVENNTERTVAAPFMSPLQSTPRQSKIAETKHLFNIMTEKLRYGRRRRGGKVSGTDEQKGILSTQIKKALFAGQKW